MIRILTASPEFLPGQIRQNYQLMIQEINRAKEEQVDIIIFPELSLTGYFIGDLWESPAFLHESEAYKEKIIAAAEGITIIFGHVAIDKNKKNSDGRLRLYNAGFVAQNQKLVANTIGHFYTIKTLLPTYGPFDDTRHFTSILRVAAEENTTVHKLIAPYDITIKDEHLQIGLLLCEDSWDENYFLSPTAILTEKQSHLLINLSASPFSLEKQENRHRLFSAHGKKYQIPTLYVNRSGVENTGKTIYLYDGITFAYNQNGLLIDESIPFQSRRKLWEFEPRTRQLIPTEKKIISHVPPLLSSLQYGLKKFLQMLSVDHVTIGLSGGIDSAVNAALYRSILPKEHLLFVNTPTQYNSTATRILAKTVAENIGAYYTEIPIDHFIDETKQMIDCRSISSKDEKITLRLSPLAKENMQARDRSSRVLAGLSSAFGGIFTCNANKTELTVGYGTFYGDLAGAVAATGDLWKYQIYQLGHELNAYFQEDIIPKDIFTLKPSAELSPQQDVTKNLGDPLIYDYHDYLFRAWVESSSRPTIEDTLRWYAHGVLEEKIHTPLTIQDIFPTAKDFICDLERWWTLYTGFAVAKRIQAPPIIAVSPRPYGTDFRESQMTPYYTDTYYKWKNKLLQ